MQVETAGSTANGLAGTGGSALPAPSPAGADAPPAGNGAAGGLGVGLAGSVAPPPAGAPAPDMPRAGAPNVGAMMHAAGSVAVPRNPAICTPAPADASPQAVMALAVVNNYRVPAGAGCATMYSEINAAAAAHCAYYDMYITTDPCVANPHLEVMGCAGFTGATPNERMKAAGYISHYGGNEVMAFFNSAKGAVDSWMNSVWHRIPIIDPWTTAFGYGHSTRCDTIDFSRGTTPGWESTIVVYPYDKQVDVPTAFYGQYEGPVPPPPPSGWPSSSPISISAQKIYVTEHVLTKDGDPTPIEHVWLDSAAEILSEEMRRQLTNVAFMYANKPFAPNTKYRVSIVGTYSYGLVWEEWSFTTGAESPSWDD